MKEIILVIMFIVCCNLYYRNLFIDEDFTDRSKYNISHCSIYFRIFYLFFFFTSLYLLLFFKKRIKNYIKLCNIEHEVDNYEKNHKSYINCLDFNEYQNKKRWLKINKIINKK